MAALETLIDAQPKHELPVAGADTTPKIQQGTTTPTVGDVNAAGANGQAAAQGAVDNHFGGVTLTDKEMNLCKETYNAPRDARSQRPDAATGLKDDFLWKDGFGVGRSVDKQGHVESCSLSPSGTIVYLKGDMKTGANEIQVVGNGGKLDVTPGPNGSMLERSSDPYGTRQEELIKGNINQYARLATSGNMQVFWGKPIVGQDGVPHTNFAISTNYDSPGAKKAMQDWKAKNNLPTDN
jgi:hypothetical protein